LTFWIGDSVSLLDPPNNVCLTKAWKDKGKALNVCRYQQVVLFIWPKQQTDRIYCQYRFDALMERIENQSLAIKPGHQKSRQLKTAEDLKLVVVFCQTQPLVT
jgi:hypothetical protein